MYGGGEAGIAVMHGKAFWRGLEQVDSIPGFKSPKIKYNDLAVLACRCDAVMGGLCGCLNVRTRLSVASRVPL